MCGCVVCMASALPLRAAPSSIVDGRVLLARVSCVRLVFRVYCVVGYLAMVWVWGLSSIVCVKLVSLVLGWIPADPV